MRVLAIDTATATGSVALVDGQQVVGEYLLNIQATHSERLMPALVRMLEDADTSGDTVDGIAVATGPGSFTGFEDRCGYGQIPCLYLAKAPYWHNRIGGSGLTSWVCCSVGLLTCGCQTWGSIWMSL